MLGFIEWVEFDRKKKEKEKKNVQSTNQGSSEVGHLYHKGEANRVDKTLSQQSIYYFPEP